MASIIFRMLLVGTLVHTTFMVPQAAAMQWQIDRQQFDSWIFQNLPNNGQVGNVRKIVSDQVEVAISLLEMTVVLDDQQKARLRLAGRGDVKRFFDDVEQARRDFDALVETEEGANNFNKAYQLAMPLQNRLTQGLFEKSSLFGKVAKRIMDDDQRKKVALRQDKLQSRKAETSLKAMVAGLSLRIPMTAQQREWLMEHGRVPVVAGSQSHMASMFSLYQLGQTPKEELEEMFDEQQLKALQASFDQVGQFKQAFQQLGWVQ